MDSDQKNAYESYQHDLEEDLATKTTVEFARSITEQQLQEAATKGKTSGKELWEILMSDLSLKSLGELLTYEIWPRGKQLQEVMVESGYATKEELEEHVAAQATETSQLGEALVDRGVLTRAQLGQALMEQQRTGHDLSRVLLNLGYVTAKQVADATRADATGAQPQRRSERVADVLRENGMVNEDQLSQLLEEAERKGEDLAEFVIAQEIVTRDALGEACSAHWGVPYVNLTLCEIAPDDARLLPEELSRNYCVIPTKKEADRLSVAMADPKEVSTIDDLSMLTGCEIAPLLAWRADIHDAINRFFPDGTVGKEESAEQASASVKDVREEGLDALVESASVTDLVASIVEGAIHAEATDIHLEPQTKDLRVRYRIDGMLYDVMTVPQSIQAPLISRVKILAKMDITQKRAPQDGHFAMLIGEREFDMRIATLPTSLGERLVIRLLNPANLFLGLKQLGLSQDAFEQVERLIHSPNGMILVTGPIGSGKTTTQYAALNQINILTDSIVTIEDPIEYELPGINQVQVDARTDCTFANILRAVLRQDVNKLLVGEIRDRETAAIAVRASVTGHLVFTTLHTRDAVGAITNLVNLDVPRFLIAGSVLAIVNQRLVRKICQNCKEEYSPEERVLRDLGYKGDIPDDLIFARGRGCNACYHTGYRGRTGIFEVLSMTEEIRGLVRGNAPEADIMAAAMTAGGRSLLSDAMRKVKKQITSVDEVARTVMFRN